jgi:hypothetical protein
MKRMTSGNNKKLLRWFIGMKLAEFTKPFGRRGKNE